MNRLLGIKKRCVAGLAALFVIMITMVSANASYEWCELMLDDAGVVTEEEAVEIGNRLSEISERYQMAVVIKTEPYLSGESPEQMADDILDSYLDESPFGGISLYICLDNGNSERRYHFSTVRDGRLAINDRGLSYLEDRVVPYLRESDFAGAFNEFADATEELYELYENGEPYNKIPTVTLVLVWGGVIAVTLLISISMLSAKMKKMKTAVHRNYAREYMKKDSLNITSSNDIFLYSVVTQTAIAKDDSGDHTSSSGETHGGTGGSF